MERYFKKKYITSLMFVVFILTFSILNFIGSYGEIKNSFKLSVEQGCSIKNIISGIENTINDKVAGKYAFIEGYGFMQRLMGKNEEGNFEVVKDKQGFMHYTFFGFQENPVYELAERTQAFKDGLKNKDTKFMYLMPPDKYIRGYSELPKGIPYNYANETADNFLELLREKEIDIIDTRENLKYSGIPESELFFKTDHHWRTETVFWEFGELVNELNNRYGMNLDPTGYYRDKENYNFITYEDSFLGSMGRKTGVAYGQLDDFTLIYPKFKTSYSYYAETKGAKMQLEGRFEEALLTVSPFRTKKGIYSLEGDKYSSYLFGNRGIVHVTNKDNPDGPKILFVKDSFSVPLAAFLSTVCSDVYLVDPRYYDKDIPEYVNSIDDLDVVIMSFGPQDLIDDFFNFYKN